jgi:G:T-mismatch repair DNA endonuclease (very short patch repair protein)
MADVHDKKTRSYNMPQIKATNTNRIAEYFIPSGEGPQYFVIKDSPEGVGY